MITYNVASSDEIIEVINSSHIKESTKESLIGTAKKWGDRKARR